MTSRERVLAALDHQETDRIPIAMVCGGINPPAMQALDEFLQINRGIDVLQALQFSAANMDPQHLKDMFGKDLCFEGGMCVQKVLPFGTPAENIAAYFDEAMGYYPFACY